MVWSDGHTSIASGYMVWGGRRGYTVMCSQTREVAMPFLKGVEPFKESENPLHKALKHPSSLQKSTLIAFLMENFVTIDANH